MDPPAVVSSSMRNVVVVVGAVAALVVGAACTTSGASSRELATGLTPMHALLSGCSEDVDDNGVFRASCEGEVAFSMKTRGAGTAEPQYRAEAFAMGSESGGAQVAWDKLEVPTEGPSGLVDRARAFPIGVKDGPPLATLIGVVRDVGGKDVQELWCRAVDDKGAQRCAELVGAALGVEHVQPARADLPVRSAPAAPPATIFGRALTVPTSCTASGDRDAGTATCGDSTTLRWRRFDDMSDAVNLVQAGFAASDDGEGTPFHCTLVGEPAECEAHQGAVGGVTYLDGKAIAVLCVSPSPLESSLCKSVIAPR